MPEFDIDDTPENVAHIVPNMPPKLEGERGICRGKMRLNASEVTSSPKAHLWH